MVSEAFTQNAWNEIKKKNFYFNAYKALTVFTQIYIEWLLNNTYLITYNSIVNHHLAVQNGSDYFYS